MLTAIVRRGVSLGVLRCCRWSCSLSLHACHAVLIGVQLQQRVMAGSQAAWQHAVTLWCRGTRVVQQYDSQRRSTLLFLPRW